MPRRKKESEGKSTVLKIMDEFDWGRILYNACYIFNKGFAEYLEDYAKRYDEGDVVVDDAEKETEKLISQRDGLIDKRKRLHDEVRKASTEKTSAFRQYAKAFPVGEVVANWRKDILAGRKTGDNIDKYRKLISNRSEVEKVLHASVEKEKRTLRAERRYIDSNLFATRTLNQKVKNIRKMVDKHSIPLGHRMSDEIKPLQELILSEGQTERLMAVCLNILNTYSEKDFSSTLEVSERERVVEGIYSFFSNFEHNYDFISGCYEVDEETHELKMKPLDVLENKIYNGYYFTIRGYVQRAYASVRFERYNVESTDMNWEQDTDNGNHGIDRKLSSETDAEPAGLPVSKEPMPLDDGMMDIWTDCNKYLWDNIEDMSDEITGELSKKFPRNPYYSLDNMLDTMPVVMSMVIDSVNEELVAGNVIGNKLKHIILDSMGGAETNEEWRQNVTIISKIMAKYIRKFFSAEKCRQVVDDICARYMEE